jgi:serine/threonine-protein kinase RsbW
LRTSHGKTINRHAALPAQPADVNEYPEHDLLNIAEARRPERPCLDALLPFVHERVDLTIPSNVEYVDAVLEYLIERLMKLGIVDSEESDVLIALDEAIVNAIKHGNKGDARKPVHIVADFTASEACFTIKDEGLGFCAQDVPDPTDPSRLLVPSGRGLLLIRHLMDEVFYNNCGNEIRMIKRRVPKSTPENNNSQEEV